MNVLKLHIILSGWFVLFFLSYPALAATVTVIPSGDNAFYVQGNAMNGATGIEISIKYDINLKSPKIEQGTVGGMFVSNPIIAANTIKIAIVSTTNFPENASIAKIIFAPHTEAVAMPIVTYYNFIDSKGAPLVQSSNNVSAELPIPTFDRVSDQPKTDTIPTPVSTTVTEQPKTDTILTPVSTTVATSTSNKNQISFGKVAFSDDISSKNDSEPKPAERTDTKLLPEDTTTSPSTVVAEQSKPENIKSEVSKATEITQYNFYKGILDRFKQFNGVKKLATMTQLFNKQIAQTIQQVPQIVLTDGKSRATLTINLPDRIIESKPNFATNNGELVSFKRDKKIKGRWLVEILPEINTTNVILTIIVGGEEFDYPLTVAPIIKMLSSLTERDWNNFLKETGTVKMPLHDLNNDGKRDYIDEYIFVANYLGRKVNNL